MAIEHIPRNGVFAGSARVRIEINRDSIPIGAVVRVLRDGIGIGLASKVPDQEYWEYVDNGVPDGAHNYTAQVIAGLINHPESTPVPVTRQNLPTGPDAELITIEWEGPTLAGLDFQWYKFNNPVEQDLYISTLKSADNGDTFLALYDAFGNVVASNEDWDFAENVYTSNLEMLPLPPGLYYIYAGWYEGAANPAFGGVSGGYETGGSPGAVLSLSLTPISTFVPALFEVLRVNYNAATAEAPDYQDAAPGSTFIAEVGPIRVVYRLAATYSLPVGYTPLLQRYFPGMDSDWVTIAGFEGDDYDTGTGEWTKWDYPDFGTVGPSHGLSAPATLNYRVILMKNSDSSVYVGTPLEYDFTVGPTPMPLIYDTFSGVDGVFIFDHTGDSGVQWLMDSSAHDSATSDNVGLVLDAGRLSTQGYYGGSNLIPTVPVPPGQPYYVEFEMFFADGTSNNTGIQILRAANTSESGISGASWMAEVGHQPEDQLAYVYGNIADVSGIAAPNGAAFVARFEFDGATMVVKINGAVVATDSDTMYQSLPGGYMGLNITDRGLSTAQMPIDNYKVDLLPGPGA